MPKAEEVMAKGTITIDAGKMALDAAKLMVDKGVGCLVTTEKGSPVGIVTERDIVRKVVATSIDPSRSKILDICSKPLITTNPDDPLEEVAKKMLLNNIRRVPVVERGKLIGIITAADIARSLVGKVDEANALLTAVARYHKEGY